MNAQIHPHPASLASGLRNHIESRELVRTEPCHKQYDELALGGRASDDVVGAVGGCIRAGRHELVFCHRHNLLTSNRGTPFHTSLMRAESLALSIRVMRPLSIFGRPGTGIQVPRRFISLLYCSWSASCRILALNDEDLICAISTLTRPLLLHG